MKKIEVEDDVFAFLQEHAEPLVDTPSTVLRRLLKIRRRSRATGDQPASRSAPAGLQSDQPDAKRTPARSSPAGMSAPLRRPSGDLLPIEDYRVAILDFLSEQDGQEAHVRDVLAGVGKILSGQFTGTDKEEVEPGKPYWHSRLPWAGTEARKDGIMATDAPRGIWRLTDKGREEAAQLERSRR